MAGLVMWPDSQKCLECKWGHATDNNAVACVKEGACKFDPRQDEIVLAGYTFKKGTEDKDTMYDLQGEFAGAFYLVLNLEEKKLEVNMNMGCVCCSKGVRHLDDWMATLCGDKPCLPEDGPCPYDDGEGCVEGVSPIDKIWNAMAEDAKEQFPDWEIEQSV
jgi:hypothetical protein